jgi:drug/metabolite transporter (DMT)-like permease
MSRSDHRRGLLAVGAAAITWSLGGILSRLIHADSFTMIAWRGLFGAAGLIAVLALKRSPKAFGAIRGLGWWGWLFVAQTAAGMMFYLAALRHTTVAHVAVIYATAPFFAAGLGWRVMRERPHWRSILAAVAALVGVGVMMSFGGAGGWLGDLYALGMTLSVAVCTVAARHARDLPILLTVCLSSLLSALVCWPLRSPLEPGSHDLALLAVFGIVNFSIGVPLYAVGAKLLPAVETSLLASLETPLAPFWVWLALGETPGPATLLGGSIVFASVAIYLVAGELRPISAASASVETAVDHIH